MPALDMEPRLVEAAYGLTEHGLNKTALGEAERFLQNLLVCESLGQISEESAEGIRRLIIKHYNSQDLTQFAESIKSKH